MTSFTIAFLLVLAIGLAHSQEDNNFKATFEAKSKELEAAFNTAIAGAASVGDAAYLKEFKKRHDDIEADIRKRLETPGEEAYFADYYPKLAAAAEGAIKAVEARNSKAPAAASEPAAKAPEAPEAPEASEAPEAPEASEAAEAAEAAPAKE